MMNARLLIALAVAGSGALAVPALAQTAQPAPQRTREIIVYGTDPCPRATDDSVVVCARRPERERYRLPEAFRRVDPPQLSQSWATRSKALATVGQTGPGTCSGIGGGGTEGCAVREIQQGVAERQEQDAGDIPPGQ